MNQHQEGWNRAKTVFFMGSLFVAFVIFWACKRENTHNLEVKDGVRYVHNLKAISEVPTAELEFIPQIGELEPEDENYLFNFPISAAADEDGNVFVLDSKESSIKKFNPEGLYLTRFGRPGQGPGELDYPMTIDCRGGRLLVTTMSSQFHLYDLKGNSIGRFRLPQYQGFDLKLMNADRVVGFAMIPGGENTLENKVLNIYDTEGNVLHKFAEPFLVETAKSTWVANFVRIAVDDDDNIFANFISQNRIEKYSNTGELLIKIDRILPFDLEYKYEKKKMEVRGKVREYMGEVFPHVSRGIGIDSEDGILLTRVPIPGEMERFDNWSMFNDRLYFVDPFGQSCIYVFKAVWK